MMNLGTNVKDDDVIKYFTTASLQHIATACITFNIWSNVIFKQNFELCHNDENYNWENIENHVFDEILKLPIPILLKNVVSHKVKQIGNNILDWVKFQNQFVFGNMSECKAFRFIHTIVLSPRGTINYKETARILIYNTDVSSIERYLIACAHFLQNEVIYRWPDVQSASIKYQPFINFWAFHVLDFVMNKRKDTNVRNTDNMSTAIDWLMYDIQKLSCSQKRLLASNESFVEFMWNYCRSENKKTYLTTLILDLSNTENTCMMLSQMTAKEQKEMFENDSRLILCRLLNNSLYEDYFLPTVYHVRNIISTHDYFHILKDVAQKMHYASGNLQECRIFYYEAIFKKMLDYANDQTKEYIFESNDSKWTWALLKNAQSLTKKNFESMRSLLSFASTAQKRKIIFSKHGVYECYHFITKNSINQCNYFIQFFNLSKNDIDIFKLFLILNVEEYISADLKYLRQDEINSFLNWCFDSEKKRCHFMKKLLYKNRVTILDKFTSSNLSVKQQKELLLDFCRNKRNLNEFRKSCCEIFCNKTIVQNISIFIKDGKFKHIDQLLNWWFINDQDAIAKLKITWCKERTLNFVSLMLALLKEPELKCLKRFAKWLFNDKETINEFKATTMKHEMIQICIHLINEWKLEVANNFISWICNRSSKRILKFKSKLLTNDYIKSVVSCSYYNDVPFEFEDIVKWFDLSTESVYNLKSLFLENGEFNFLSKFMEKHKKII